MLLETAQTQHAMVGRHVLDPHLQAMRPIVDFYTAEHGLPFAAAVNKSAASFFKHAS